MKNTVISAVVILLLCCLAACSAEKEYESPQTPVSSGQVSSMQPEEKKPVDLNEIDWASAYRYSMEAYDENTDEYVYTYGAIDRNALGAGNIEGTAIFTGGLTDRGGGFTTLSYTENGEEKIIGRLSETVTVSQREKYINSIDSIFAGEETRNIHISDYMDEASTGYSEEYGKQVTMRTNCSWNITPSKYLYINYDKDDRQPKRLWTEEIEKMIAADTGSTDTPTVIRESWEFKTGGYNIAIVNACNIYHNGFYTPIEYSEDIYASSEGLPYGENHYIYALTVIFCNDKIVRCINTNGSEKLYMPVLLQPLNRDEGIKASFVPPSADHDGGEESVNMVVMRNSQGELRTYKMYYLYYAQDILYGSFYNETQPSFRPVDVDGDGIREIIGFGVSEAHNRDRADIVYRITGNSLVNLGRFGTNGFGYMFFPFEYTLKFSE